MITYRTPRVEVWRSAAYRSNEMARRANQAPSQEAPGTGTALRERRVRGQQGAGL